MKTLTKKIWAVALAVVMVLAMTVTAMAAGTGTITIYPPAGTDANATTTYKVYKVFAADGNETNISYKLVNGKSLTGEMAAYFDVDSAGNVTVKAAAMDNEGDLTAGAIEAIAAYVQGDTEVTTITTTGTTEGTATGLENGFYYVTTTTGMVAIVTSTNQSYEVAEKKMFQR